MTQFPIDELSRILKLSPKLAAECYHRYQDFHAEDNQPLQAILAYTGVVFKNISPVPCGAFILDVPVIVLAGDNNINISILDLD